MSGLVKLIRTRSSDVQAVAFWGVTAGTTAMWIVQELQKQSFEFTSVPTVTRMNVDPFDWIKKTFFEKAEPQ